MNLQTFITETLVEICHGVAEAQKRCPPNTIVPGVRVQGQALQKDLTHFQTVDFEVSVSIDEKAKTGGKIRVTTGVFNIGGGGDSEVTSGHTATLKFKVPIMFQKGKNPPTQ